MTAASPLDILDPEIATFVRQMMADAAAHPPREQVTPLEARAIAETVRRRWTEGGPVMADTTEHAIATRHGDVRIRIHRPAGVAAPAPALIYLHGGGFVLFSLDTHDRLMREYASRARMVVIGVDYSLAPEVRFPRPPQEVVDVVRALHARAAEFGIDPARIALGGDSAGGNLTVSACLAFRDAGEAPVSAMVLNYGGFSMELVTPSVVRFGGGNFLLTTHMMLWFLMHYVADPDQRFDPRLRVLDADLAGLPPAWMVITDCDPLYDENIEMRDRLIAAGVTVDAKVYPGTVHSFLEAVSIARVAGEALDDTARWLNATLAP
ncbi:acetylesterase [Tistrella bauzanensis]|uniref:Acetylesterase n=1 Tax=Tistrella bauzanensis TaxID=657419 RepID=A0ABQ1IF05_9PROT|nr:alpha/beta hydrolase fold domain-containing protein [Tistrella bauzanensis]GGB36527.1 acetylesterase [Tistrella bauzanensis]